MSKADFTVTLIADGHVLPRPCYLDTEGLNVEEFVRVHKDGGRMKMNYHYTVRYSVERDGWRYRYLHDGGCSYDGADLAREIPDDKSVTYRLTTAPGLRPYELGGGVLLWRRRIKPKGDALEMARKEAAS